MEPVAQRVVVNESAGGLEIHIDVVVDAGQRVVVVERQVVADTAYGE